MLLLLLLLLRTFYSNNTDRRRLWLSSLERHQKAPGPVKPPNRPLPLRQHEAIWQIKADKANKLAHGDGFPSAQQKINPGEPPSAPIPSASLRAQPFQPLEREAGLQGQTTEWRMYGRRDVMPRFPRLKPNKTTTQQLVTADTSRPVRAAIAYSLFTEAIIFFVSILIPSSDQWRDSQVIDCSLTTEGPLLQPVWERHGCPVAVRPPMKPCDPLKASKQDLRGSHIFRKS